MYGIDISNWQSDLKIKDIAAQIEFAIVKATEGIGYVDPTCNDFIEQLKASNKLWGFYHFARGNDAKQEARYFYENTRNYFTHGIPVLDYETSENISPSAWVESFCKELYKLSGVKPLIYCSASVIKSLASPWVCENCGLWVAGYPQNYTTFDNYEMPYNISPWPFAAIWQFTSSLQLRGYNGNLDGNIAYMDAKGWAAYANATGATDTNNSNNHNSNNNGSSSSITTEQALQKMAEDVIAGKYGNGNSRIKAIYEAVQNKVNKILGE